MSLFRFDNAYSRDAMSKRRYTYVCVWMNGVSNVSQQIISSTENTLISQEFLIFQIHKIYVTDFPKCTDAPIHRKMQEILRTSNAKDQHLT